MPTFSAEELRTLVAQCFMQVAVPRAEAEQTARLMVEANLTGHDTHGVRQTPRYVDLIEKGLIKAGAPVTVLKETPTTALLDGHDNLGYVAASIATEKAIEMARKTHLSAVGIRNLNHVGRVGAYPEMIAAAGFVGLVTVNAQSVRGSQVTPFGGLAARLGTNPMAAAFPNPQGDPVLLDFATSAVAANKIRQAKSRGKQMGGGIMILKDGTPTTNPDDYIQGRALMLPLGGEQGHKGYALSVMVDILSGILAGSGTTLHPSADLNNGTFIVCIDPEAFTTRGQYEQDLTEYVDHLRATPTLPGAPPVQVPGDYEARNRRQRQKDGIALEPPVWEDLRKCAERLGVGVPVPIAAQAG
jgi:LDH2 family malate/lactate/ureidoglycolate dehydrogenase